ncbi:helix-turn-helix domain-containing protein [Miltoncostaea marina]|uniref:helix-turn-helix domain-containing protein n=1 Tax=Miltoncostaea marina TaxID=2843215 RepID=UPI003CCE8BD4
MVMASMLGMSRRSPMPRMAPRSEMTSTASEKQLPVPPEFLEAALHHTSRKPDRRLVGETLRGLRENADMTVEELSATVGVSPEFVKAVEAGKGGRPSPAYLSRVVQALAGDIGAGWGDPVPMDDCLYDDEHDQWPPKRAFDSRADGSGGQPSTLPSIE